MSKPLKKLNSDELREYHKIITDELIKKYQKEYDNSLFPKKSPTDKIDCKICGIVFTRRTKAQHDISNRHLKGLVEIRKNIDLLFQ